MTERVKIAIALAVSVAVSILLLALPRKNLTEEFRYEGTVTEVTAKEFVLQTDAGEVRLPKKMFDHQVSVGMEIRVEAKRKVRFHK